MHALNSNLLPRRRNAKTRVGVIYLVIPNSAVYSKNRTHQKNSTKSETPKLLFSGIFTVLTSVSYSVSWQEIGVFIARDCDCSGGGGLFY
jgi:hypothetical protein